jgi:F-type H+-transporting ATPase subunit delta
MTSPFFSKDEKKKIITNVFKKIISETLLNFLYVLIDHNRFNLLRDIRKEFDKFIREENKILMIQVKSVKPLSEKEIDNVRKALKHKYTKYTLEIENVIDEDILGGFQIIVDDEVIDYTLKSGLLRLKESI